MATMETVKEKAKILYDEIGDFLTDEEKNDVDVETVHADLCEIENVLDEAFGFSDLEDVG